MGMPSKGTTFGEITINGETGREKKVVKIPSGFFCMALIFLYSDIIELILFI